MDAGVLAEAVRLMQDRRPFALATVVWRRAPSSGHVGSKGIVLDDGRVHGFIGGACAEPAVIRESLDALADGRPRLVFLGPADELAAEEPSDLSPQESRIGGIRDAKTRAVPMACDGEGALEVYIEPFLPAPQLVAVGRSPAVHALTVQARTLGWDVAVIDDGGRVLEHPYPELVRTSLDLSELGIGPSTAIVIATQGHYDDLALRAALATDAGYIGVVAAEKRASSIVQLLREDGASDEQVARVHAPAGLDLGAVDNAEIAVAVLADLVARRAAGQLRRVVPATVRREAIDPVCGMIVFVDDAKYHTVHDAVDYWFCTSGCQRAFERDPASFVA
jgi:xanthine dehydrogenase accessory factor